MPQPNPTNAQIRSFLDEAELDWFKVFDSGRNGDTIEVGDAEYSRLPERFNSRAKIIAYFRRHWSLELSAAMFCNLRTIMHNGALHVISSDPGAVPISVVRLTSVARNGGRLTVKAVLDDGFGEQTSVSYGIRAANGRMTIVDRTERANDYRYAACRAGARSGRRSTGAKGRAARPTGAKRTAAPAKKR